MVSALRARANFGKLLRRVEVERRSLVIEKRGSPKAVLLSIRDYVRLAAPEPEVLKVIGEESKRKGTERQRRAARKDVKRFQGGHVARRIERFPGALRAKQEAARHESPATRRVIAVRSAPAAESPARAP